MNDARGQVVYDAPSNRAPQYQDGVTAGAGGLLASNATRTVRVTSAEDDVTKPLTVVGGQEAVNNAAPAVVSARPGVARRVRIWNGSGQPAEITLTVLRDQRVVGGGGTETMRTPLYLADGESVEIEARVVSLVERNAGAGAQTGRGVRYLFTLEPSNR